MALSEYEVNMACLLGESITVENIGELKPLKINEINAMSFNAYNQSLSLLCISSDDVAEILEDDIMPTEPFEFILDNCKASKEFELNMTTYLNYFLREPVVFDREMESFWVGIEGNVNIQNYDRFIDLIKIQNCISDNVKRPQPRNEAEKAYYKQLKASKEKYKNLYGCNETDLNDIISAVCSKHSSINLLNIGDFTMYQIIDTYKRLSLIDEYENTITAMVHGASGENSKLKHWSSKIKDS